MKKICTYILFLFLPILSIGQIQVGVKGGYIYYWFTQPDDGDYKYNYDYSHNAFSVAVSIRQRTTKTFNPGCEIEYTNRSFTVNSVMTGLGGGSSHDFHYTIGNIYIQVQPQFSFGSKVKFFFYPGIYFGTLLHSSLQGTESSWQMGNPSSTDTIDGSAKGYYPGFEFGVVIGLGLEFPIYKNLSGVFENKCSMNVLPIAGSWGSDKTKMVNLYFEFGIAYNFSKTKR
jgi:hypothetical protein